MTSLTHWWWGCHLQDRLSNASSQWPHWSALAPWLLLHLADLAYGTGWQQLGEEIHSATPAASYGSWCCLWILGSCQAGRSPWSQSSRALLHCCKLHECRTPGWNNMEKKNLKWSSGVRGHVRQSIQLETRLLIYSRIAANIWNKCSTTGWELWYKKIFLKKRKMWTSSHHTQTETVTVINLGYNPSVGSNKSNHCLYLCAVCLQPSCKLIVMLLFWLLC